MQDEKLFQLIRDCIDIEREEPVCLNFSICNKKLVVIGDTHGDIRTTQLIFDKYFSDPEYQFIFLGDEIDRQTSSLSPDDNITYLLEMKRDNPERIFFLLGNHNLNPYSKKYPTFQPCNFWDHLSDIQRNYYTSLFSTYSFIAKTENGVVLCHASLPIYNDLSNFDISDKAWQECLWANYSEDLPSREEINKRKLFRKNSLRPKRYSYHFHLSMYQFDKNLMIRGHDPHAKLTMFNNKCVTLQTTRSFSRIGVCDRRIAIIDLSKKNINSARDIQILNIDRGFTQEVVS